MALTLLVAETPSLMSPNGRAQAELEEEPPALRPYLRSVWGLANGSVSDMHPSAGLNLVAQPQLAQVPLHGIVLGV